MRYLKLLALVLCLTAFMTGCTRVAPGYAGIVVHNYGDQKGVDDFPVRVGRIWFNPFTTDVYSFPTFTQNIVWTHDRQEGSPNDDSITFSDRNGVTINADVALSYSILGEKVPAIFVKFRQGVDHLTNVYMRTKVREAFNEAGSGFEAIQIVGTKKGEFHATVMRLLDEELGEIGFVFDTVAMVGQPRLEQKVQEAINSALEATQRAIRAENEVREREAMARQKIADAEGEAEAIRLKAEAEAEANRIVAASVTSTLVEYEAVKRWQGQLPQVTGGAVPFIQLPRGGGQ